MSLPRIRLSDVPALPWANGHGTTRELLREESPDGRLLLRLSVADVVGPGPFSRFPGIDRVLVAIEGPGFDLAVDGRRMAVRPLEPVAFAGEAEVAVTAIAAPSRDFNVMTGRALVRADVVVRSGAFHIPSEGRVLVFVVSGRFAVADEASAFEPGDLVDLDASASALFEGGGCALIITIHRREV